MLVNDDDLVMYCCDCDEPAMVEDVVDTWVEDGQAHQYVEWLCLGDKIRRQQERRRKTENPVV